MKVNKVEMSFITVHTRKTLVQKRQFARAPLSARAIALKWHFIYLFIYLKKIMPFYTVYLCRIGCVSRFFASEI